MTRDLNMSGHEPIHDAIARSALDQYGLERPELVFIRHNENLTYQVTDGAPGERHGAPGRRDGASGGRYVLRVHWPAEGVSPDTPQHSRDALTAELEFIQAIGEHTDIAVQTPVRTTDGQLVCIIADSGSVPRVRPGPLYATLLTWVDGHAMRDEDPEWEHQAYLTGIMTAKLHDFSAWWSPKHALHRHRYDQALLQDKVRVIEDGLRLGLLTPAQYRTIQAGAERICWLMDQLDHRPDASGLIHADLQKSNLIVNGETVTPIDFALCGYGHFLQDIGGLSADFAPLNIRQAMLSGYRTVRALPDSDLPYVEAFFVGGILLFMATHLHNPRVHEWFGRRIPVICAKYLEPLIRGDRFYEDI